MESLDAKNDGDLIERVLEATWENFREELHTTPVTLFNESVFRWLFIRQALRVRPKPCLQLEWNHVDLLVQEGHAKEEDSKNHLVEFKFYLKSRHRFLSGNEGRWKGGPGMNNSREFWKCVEKLRNIETAGWRQHPNEQGAIDTRNLILVFADRSDQNKTGQFSHWYAPLIAPDGQPAAERHLKELHAPACSESTCSLHGYLYRFD